MRRPAGFSYKLGQKQHRLIDLVRILRKRGDELFIFGESDKKRRPSSPDELGFPVDSRDRFMARCKNGHFRETRAEHLINHGCGECVERVERVLKYSIDDLILAAHRNNGECLSPEYLGFEKTHLALFKWPHVRNDPSLCYGC